MRRLLTGYAINFNHRHSRVGHLFQNRYKSIVCEEEIYLLELVRYIHLNPLRAEQVQDFNELAGYPWCGHGVLAGNNKLEGQIVDEVLLRFGSSLYAARKQYLQFVKEGMDQGKRPELVGGGLRRSNKITGVLKAGRSHDDRILGSGSFVDQLCHEKFLKERIGTRISLGDLVGYIAEIYGIEPDELSWRTRNKSLSEARSVLCFSAVRLLGVKGIEVGEILHMGNSAVSQAVQRGADTMLRKSEIKEKIESFFLNE